MPQALPTVVIVGRPNVGKSTLFNRITGKRRSIVGDEPGITRDRISGTAEHDGRRFELIDTGGIVVQDQEYIPSQILHQAEVAFQNAAHIIFLVDAAPKSHPQTAIWLECSGASANRVTLVVNKADTAERRALAHEFYELGIPDIYAVRRSTAPGSTSYWIT